MNLSPMRFKNYIWPHNPRVYEIGFARKMASQHVPFGRSVLSGLGMDHRVLRGEGEFVGEGAYREFQKLATVFYEESPGILVHPVWQTANAWFVELSVRQEPTEDYVRYGFTFWECYDGYHRGLAEVGGDPAEAGNKSGGVYRAARGHAVPHCREDRGGPGAVGGAESTDPQSQSNLPRRQDSAWVR